MSSKTSKIINFQPSATVFLPAGGRGKGLKESSKRCQAVWGWLLHPSALYLRLAKPLTFIFLSFTPRECASTHTHFHTVEGGHLITHVLTPIPLLHLAPHAPRRGLPCEKLETTLNSYITSGFPPRRLLIVRGHGRQCTGCSPLLPAATRCRSS